MQTLQTRAVQATCHAESIVTGRTPFAPNERQGKNLPPETVFGQSRSKVVRDLDQQVFNDIGQGLSTEWFDHDAIRMEAFRVFQYVQVGVSAAYGDDGRFWFHLQ